MKAVKYRKEDIFLLRLFVKNDYTNIIVYKNIERFIEFKTSYLSKYIYVYKNDEERTHFRILLSDKDFAFLKGKYDENKFAVF